MTSPVTDADGIRDFSITAARPFRIGSDVFTPPPVMGSGGLRQLATMYGKFNEVSALSATDGDNIDTMLSIVTKMFRTLLPGPDGTLFIRRLTSLGRPEDPTGEDSEDGQPHPADPEPVDLIRQAIPIMLYMLEEYGLRPTTPSLGSATGSTTETDPSGSTSSTAGASASESTTDA